MNDPFDVLHRPPEFAPVRTVPDETFRSEVLRAARARLDREDSLRPTPDHTPFTVEPITMPGTNASPVRRRPLLLAAACVVLLALSVTGILALSGGDDDPDSTDAGRAGAVETSEPSTTPPPTTPPPTTAEVPAGTSAPATTAGASSPPPRRDPATDDDAARPLLLSAEEYGRGWTRQPAPGSLSAAVDPGVARAVPECRAFVDTVFVPIDDAQHANTLFNLAYPPAAFTQYAVLFDDAETARSVFAEVNSSAFVPCSRAYAEATAGTNCCDGEQWFPSPVHEQVVDAPFDTTGLTLTYRRFEASWTDTAGNVHGPELLVDVVLLHDRAMTFFGTLAAGEDGATVQSDADIERSVRSAVVRMEDVTGVASTMSRGLGTPAAAAIGTDVLGVGWSELVGTTYRDVDFDPVLSSQCEPFVADVYDVFATAPTANRVFTSPPPTVDFAQHYVAMLASTDVARIAFEELTSPDFTECARTQVRMFEALKRPTVLDGPSTAGADEIVWYHYGRPISDDVTRDYAAVVARVGRVVFYLDTFTGLDGDESVMDTTAFEALVEAAVARARDATG